MQRLEEERRHKDKMKLYEEKLKEKEAELKKMDDAIANFLIYQKYTSFLRIPYKRAFEVKRIQEDDQ